MRQISQEKGVTLLVTILLMSVVFFLGLYFLSFSLTEKRIAQGQAKGVKTYHLAEAGIEEMIWRLKHLDSYKNNFESDRDWSQSFSRSSPFGGNGSYSVTINNTGLAQGNIEAVGSITDSAGNTSQRVVRTTVYKAIASSTDVDDYALFSDNDVNISLSRVDVPTSSVHANHDVDVSGLGTEVNIENDLEAVNRFEESSWATVNVGGEIMDSYDHSPPPPELEMPSVSFSDSDDPASLRERADIIYTESEFEDLLNNSDGGSLTLDSDITYVEGGVVVNDDVELNVNGLLAADGDIKLGDTCWLLFCCGDHTDITVNHSSSSPAGLIANGNVKFDFCVTASDINGVVYATKDVVITDFSDEVNFEGGIYGRNIDILSVWQDNSTKFNEAIINDSLETTEFSPVVTVEHWEEEY